MRTFKPQAIGDGAFALVCCRRGDETPTKLIEGLKDSLVRQGASLRTFDLFYLDEPRFLPLIARELVYTGRYDAVVCAALVDEGLENHLREALDQVMLDGRTLVMGFFSQQEDQGERESAQGARALLEAMNLISTIRTMEGRQ